MDSRFLTAGELAALLRLRPSTIKSWAREGRIPCMRFSKGVVRFDLDAVREAIAAEAEHPPATRSGPAIARPSGPRLSP